MTCKDCIHSGLCYKENDYENFPNRCGNFIPEIPQGDLISREALKKSIEECKYCGFYGKLIELIDNAPTVEVEPEKIAIANVSFDENKLKEIVQTEVIDKIKNGELVLKAEEGPQGNIFPMEIVAGKCPIEADGNCPLRPQGEWIPVSERLPEYSGLYLISVDDLVTVANFTGTYFMHRGGGIRVKVNAWQPLPEPYKKGGAE